MDCPQRVSVVASPRAGTPWTIIGRPSVKARCYGQRSARQALGLVVGQRLDIRL